MKNHSEALCAVHIKLFEAIEKIEEIPTESLICISETLKPILKSISHKPSAFRELSDTQIITQLNKNN